MPTFRHGKDTRVLVGSYEMSNMLREYTMSSSVNTGDTTAFTSSNKTYVTGIEDGAMSLSGMFSAQGDTTADIDPYFNTIFGQATPIEVTVGIEGTFALGSQVAILDAIETDYDIKGPVEDMVSVTTKFQGTGGVLTGDSLHDLVDTTATANGSSVDSGTSPASTSRGMMGVLHVTAKTGTPTLTVKIQDSSDNGTFNDRITFTAATGIGSQWAVTSPTQTIARYVRAIWTISGGSPHITWQCSFARF